MPNDDRNTTLNDTEEKATERYMLGGFGKLGSKSAYKRYAKHVAWIRKMNGVEEQTIDPREWVGYIFTPKWKDKT
jgi:hypothetical protein